MRTVASVLSLLAPLVSLSAQVQPSIGPGARVRVTVPSAAIADAVGTWVATADSVMEFRRDGQPDIWRIDPASITRLEMSRGRKSNLGKGAAYGFLAGATIGAFVGGVAAEEADHHRWGCPSIECGLKAGAYLGVGWGILGTFIGAAVITDRWEEVPLDRLRLRTAVLPSGVGLAASVRF